MNQGSRLLLSMLVLSALFLGFILLMQPTQILLYMDKIPILFPSGWVAVEQRNLLLIIQALMLLVIIPVYIFTFIFSWRYRAGDGEGKYDPDFTHSTAAEIAWWGVPTIMLLFIGYITFVKTYELDPYKPLESDKPVMKVQVVALDWKWLFIYPEEGIATVNYLQLVKDRPVHFFITADAPMNAFWIPHLGGMIYAMPGMQTQLNLVANEEGVWTGRSAHISGKGFSKMLFQTVSTSEEAHAEWVASVQNSTRVLDHAAYDTLVKPTIGHPEELFRLGEPKLYDQIMAKYMYPQEDHVRQTDS